MKKRLIPCVAEAQIAKRVALHAFGLSGDAFETHHGKTGPFVVRVARQTAQAGLMLAGRRQHGAIKVWAFVVGVDSTTMHHACRDAFIRIIKGGKPGDQQFRALAAVVAALAQHRAQQGEADANITPSRFEPAWAGQKVEATLSEVFRRSKEQSGPMP